MPRSHRYLPTSGNPSDSNRKILKLILDSSLTGYTKVSPFLLPNVSWIHCTFSINTAFILILILANPILNYGKPSSTLFCRGLVDFHPIFLVRVSVLAQWESSIECIKNKLPQAALFLSPPMCLSKGTLPSKHFSWKNWKKTFHEPQQPSSCLDNPLLRFAMHVPSPQAGMPGLL